ALSTAGVGSKVHAAVSGRAILLRITDSTVSSVDFSAALDNPADTELGFTDKATFTRPLIAAGKDVPTAIGRLSSDTTLSITPDGGSATAVTIYADDTAENTSILALVADVNQALSVATI